MHTKIRAESSNIQLVTLIGWGQHFPPPLQAAGAKVQLALQQHHATSHDVYSGDKECT